MRDCTVRSRHRSLSRSERKCWHTNHHRYDEQDEPPDINMEIGLECETTAQSVSSGMQMLCSELVKCGDWNFRTDGTRKQSTARREYRGE